MFPFQSSILKLVVIRECISNVLQLLYFFKSSTVMLMAVHFAGVIETLYLGARTDMLLPVWATVLEEARSGCPL